MTSIAAPPTSAAPAPTTPSATPSLLPLLADIEAVLGLRPEQSLVLRIRRRRRPFAVLRVDLPRSRPSGVPPSCESAAFARALTASVARVAGAAAVEVVVYLRPDHDAARDAPPPSAERLAGIVALVTAVTRALSEAGYAVLGAGCVDGRLHTGLDLASERSAPPRWSPMPRSLEASPRLDPPGAGRHPAPGAIQGATGSADGRGRRGATARDPHHGPFVPIVPVSEARRLRALATLSELEADLGAGGAELRGHPAPERSCAETMARSGEDIVDRLVRWRAVVEPGATAPSDARAIALAWSLRDTLVRDCVLMQCAWGFEAGLVALQESLPGLGAPTEPDSRPPADPGSVAPIESGRGVRTEHGPMGARTAGAAARPEPGLPLLETVLGAGRRPPSAALLRRSIDALRSVVARVPASISVAPLGMLAWLEWARGRGSVAAAYVDAALRIDPDHELARLLRAVLDCGCIPEWLE